jgi:hypothetical protein
MEDLIPEIGCPVWPFEEQRTGEVDEAVVTGGHTCCELLEKSRQKRNGFRGILNVKSIG